MRVGAGSRSRRLLTISGSLGSAASATPTGAHSVTLLVTLWRKHGLAFRLGILADEGGWAHAERGGDCTDRLKRDAAVAAHDLIDEGTAEARRRSKLQLSQPPALAELAHIGGELRPQQVAECALRRSLPHGAMALTGAAAAFAPGPPGWSAAEARCSTVGAIRALASFLHASFCACASSERRPVSLQTLLIAYWMRRSSAAWPRAEPRSRSA